MVWRTQVNFAPQPLPPRLKETEQLKESINAQFKKLLTANLVVRLSNFSMWKVSTSAGKVAPQEFITGEPAGNSNIATLAITIALYWRTATIHPHAIPKLLRLFYSYSSFLTQMAGTDKPPLAPKARKRTAGSFGRGRQKFIMYVLRVSLPS